MEAALGVIRYGLYRDWQNRIEAELYPNVLVRTEELDWMGKEGELEETLRKAMRHLAQVTRAGEMRMSNAMNDIAGLWSQETIDECESIELAGTCLRSNWPPAISPPVTRALAPERKPWWKFWSRAE